jgi:hypothetical protein
MGMKYLPLRLLSALLFALLSGSLLRAQAPTLTIRISMADSMPAGFSVSATLYQPLKTTPFKDSAGGALTRIDYKKLKRQYKNAEEMENSFTVVYDSAAKEFVLTGEAWLWEKVVVIDILKKAPAGKRPKNYWPRPMCIKIPILARAKNITIQLNNLQWNSYQELEIFTNGSFTPGKGVLIQKDFKGANRQPAQLFMPSWCNEANGH